MILLWAGLAIGAVYALVAVGCNIVFIASGVFNFAQAYVLMIGSFTALISGAQLGLPLWAAIIFCAVVGALVGAVEEVVAIRRLSGKGADNELVTTLGFSVILSGIAFVIWGPNPLSVSYFAGQTAFDFLGGRIEFSDVLLILVSILVAGATGLFARKSIIGLAGLATAEDRAAAMLRGVNVKALSLGAFALGGALVAAGAPLVASKTLASYSLGDSIAVKVFVVLAIGGIGSQRGALVGGFAVGLVEVFSARYLGGDWAGISVFILLVIVLLVRPSGLFGQIKKRVV
ncbi:branched-chain amino acid ABC transporter permease [Arthrobacter sp. AZCC_0090]|uniref:branched-chain amino acid ABC transporter permease n=1 Tax=Arthrobacter sp. AZCC_0090 TaxID=2735881 RepID=UPI001616542E|nr:branched-chain amino acid ABC transporter permease [Arthrobacter sp. AZCC_0090]MBB6407197.1 branched-chain amino acid transport system permease protein [Arthrobacter sp. AZCC_0090]